jgi:curved DNA-binding protein CbpA
VCEEPSGPRPSPQTPIGTTTRSRSPRDYYTLLGIRRDATSEQLERAFRRYVRQNHPDLVFGDPVRHSVAQARLKEVLGAMPVLRDPIKRAQYDAQLDHLPLASRLGPPGEGAD